MPPTTSWQPVLISSAEAAALIPDEASIAVSGFGYMGVAHSIHSALVARFLKSGSPRKLTYIHAAGHAPERGGDLLAREGLLDRIIGGHWGAMGHVRRKIGENGLEAHNWPQGTIVKWFGALGRGEAGVSSSVGLKTCIDPRQDGGCMNARTKEKGSMISLIENQQSGEKLSFPPLPIDFAILRGWSADRYGNVTLGHEPLSLSLREIALAAKARGGKVICQVREHHPTGRHQLDQIVLPGFLIDYLVVSEDPANDHRQCDSIAFDDKLLDYSQEDKTMPPVLEGLRGWIGRRASMEIEAGNIYNVGIGIPGDTVSAALAEAGRLENVLPTLESGVVGGVGVVGDFGVVINPFTRMDQGTMFDLYHSGLLDISVMGAAEIAANGDINVSKFGGRGIGCGGFIDITQNARKVVFCTPFTTGGLEVRFHAGKLEVVREGEHRKFLKSIQQITFSGALALAKNCPVVLVTERCVFHLTANGWSLEEVAPGIDPHRDIFNQMEFQPLISPRCREMAASCFAAGPT